jgi:hypothetical protein
MAKIITYGLGGYDPTKPNNNIVEIIENDEPEIIPDPQTDAQALADALTQLPEETLNALKQALGL